MNWLLLRGLSREQRHWGDFPETLQAALGEPVRCIDAPGFGTEHQRTSPRTVAAITDDMRSRLNRGDDAWSVVGISLGGMVALDWCARYPEDFARAVVINTSAADSLPHQRFRPASLPALATRRWRKTEAHERSVLEISSNSTSLDKDALAREWARWAADRPPSEASIAGQAIAATRFSAPRTITVPLLVLASRGDRLVSHRCSERIARRYGAPLHMHDSAGHDLPLDDPDWVCREVLGMSG